MGFEGQKPDKRHCQINDFLLLFVSFVEAPRLVNDILSLFLIFLVISECNQDSRGMTWNPGKEELQRSV